MSNLELANLLFPNITKTPEDYFLMYPKRNLPEGASVTRFAPSPTGFMHIGNLFSAFASERKAHLSNGIFILRIEDTDKKREVENGVSGIINRLSDYKISYDEGIKCDNSEIGEYGPYVQSKRREIYHAFVKVLVEHGLAYPCFMTEDELAELREIQEKNKELPGCYGKYAKYRDITFEQAKELIDSGKEYVVRFRSQGSLDKRVVFEDRIKGKIEMPENITDVVLLKSDGIPTYHFAHVVDDTLMRVTDVVRGDEWISSAPIHLQLFDALAKIYPDNVKRLKYAHIAPIMKEDNGGKRKISKRKDPEAAVTYFIEKGYPIRTMRAYMLNLLNSDFEDWRRANQDECLEKFPFTFKKMSVSGALFDMKKLDDISKTEISRMSANDVAQLVCEWAYAYDKEFFKFIAEEQDGKSVPKKNTVDILSIDRGGNKPRKDIAKWTDVKDYISYFFDELFTGYEELPSNISKEDCVKILNAYKNVYEDTEDKNLWFETVKSICEPLNFSPDVKAYKACPENFKGHVGDVSTIIRIAVTGRKQTPDLCSICRILGKNAVCDRIEKYTQKLSKGSEM